MEAQAYFDNLKSQGFDDEFAQKHTRQYYPDFSLNPAASVGNVGNHNAWISQNFQHIAAECYPDDEGAVFTIADIRNNGQVIEVIAHSNPSIGYDPVRYDFIIINGIPALESTSTPNPDGSWSPFFSTGVSSEPSPAPISSPAAYVPPIVHQTHPPQAQQMGHVAAQQQPMMQGQPMQAYGQGQPVQAYGQQGMMMQQHVGSRSKIVTFLLGFFLGVFGVHNFYLGKTGLGIAQLLITILTFGIGVIITGPWALIESILALVSSNFRDGDGMPLSD